MNGLETIANRHKTTAGKVALAWVLAQGHDIIPIPGTTRLEVCLRDHWIDVLCILNGDYHRISKKTWML